MLNCLSMPVQHMIREAQVSMRELVALGLLQLLMILGERQHLFEPLADTVEQPAKAGLPRALKKSIEFVPDFFVHP
jgi:hypothetical protein